MTHLLKYELNRLWYSYALIYALPICVLTACVTQFVVAGNPQSPAVFGMAFEFFVPHLLVIAVPAFYTAKEQQKGIVRTSLLCGQNRYKIFIAKAIVYYSAIIFVLGVYMLLITLMNAKGMQIQIISDENSFVYFLRCASIGFSYSVMLSSILLLTAMAFGNSIVPVVAGLSLFLIDFIMKSTVDWRIADKIVPGSIVEAMLEDSSDTGVIISFTLLVVIVSLTALFIAMIIFRKRSYK